MNLTELAAAYPEYENQLEYTTERKARESDVIPFEKTEIDSSITADISYDGLYSHQAKALGSLQRGDDICVTTETASGKTLIYSLYIATEVVPQGRTALLVYPTKALARDQKEELERLYEATDISVHVYDGDVGTEQKRTARNEADVIITNFQGMNYYLSHHEKWDSFFSSLSFVVVDEAHSYNGVEGMHVAWIARRILRIAEDYYSRDPQLTLTSATIGNPVEHTKTLVGRTPTVIDTDGSPQGRQTIGFWNPPTYRDKEGVLQRKSSHKEAARVFATAVAKGSQSLLFTSSRQLTEQCALWAEAYLDEKFSDSDVSIEPYHAGHSKSERRRVENQLKNGTLDGVVSTTALEMGIDIGGMEAVVLDGYPGRRTQFWQRIGRAGRGTNESVALLVAGGQSIDQFVVDNPNYLFDASVENAVVNLENKSVLAKHLAAAANENPITSRDAERFGPKFETALSELRRNNMIDGRLTEKIQYTGSERPEANISMYSTAETTFDVEIHYYDTSVETLPPVEAERAFREFYEGAIYLHKGEQYKVTERRNTEAEQKVILRPGAEAYHTQPNTNVQIEQLREQRVVQLTESLSLHHGTGTVKETYPSYRKIYHDDRKPEVVQLSSPAESRMRTDLLWFEISERIITYIQKHSPTESPLGAMHAAEHALIKMAPAALTVDNADLGGLSQSNNAELSSPTIFIYDGIADGAGFSTAMYDNIQGVTEKTYHRIQSCSCDTDQGCPSCTMSSMCGDGNEPLSKSGASAFLAVVQEALREQST